MRHCPQCKARVREQTRFCTACGFVLPVTCTICESELHVDDRFCRQCGRSVFAPILLEPCPACRRGFRAHSRFCNHCGVAIGPFWWAYAWLVVPACAVVALIVWAIV